MELTDILSWVGAIGVIITIIGVFLTYYQIQKVRRQQLLENMRRAFSAVCKLPSPEVAKYEQVYEEIFSYYTFNKNISYTDKKYFSRCVGNHYVNKIDLDKSDAHYRFPLIYKQYWLKSNNNMLQIEKDGPCDFAELKDEKNIIYKPAHDFLEALQIENYSAFLASLGKQIWNAKTFDLCSIKEKEEDHMLQLRFVLGCYFNYVNYYDLISKELYFHLYTLRNKEFSKRALRKLLPKKFILRNSVNSILEFKNRPVKLGINVFVLMKKDNDRYCTFIQKRGMSQVEYPGFYHVAPAGTFQPLSEFDKDTVQIQCNFPFTVLRELLEEVYDLEKADRNRDVDPFDIFRIEKRSGFSPGMCLLNQSHLNIYDGIPFKNDKYEIIPTGFLIDLVTLKPELTVLLHIMNSDVYIKSKANVEGNWEGPVKEFEIEAEPFVRFLNQNLNIDNFLPAGAVALAEGLNYYFTTIKQKSA